MERLKQPSDDRRARWSPFAAVSSTVSWVLLFSLVLIGVASCRRKPPETDEGDGITRRGDGSLALAESSPLRKQLVVEAIVPREFRRRLVAPASVEADPARLAKVAPPLTGQVKQLLVRQGEMVTKGQPLFLLDAPDLVAARADFLRAKSVLVQAEQALKRQKDLFDHAVAAQRDVEEAQTAADVASEDMQRAEVRLKLLGIDSASLESPLTVRSPLSGQVLSLATAPGEFRNDATATLLVVADLSVLWVTANVPERDVERVHVGDEAITHVAAFPAEEFHGQVHFIENLLDPDTRSVKVRIQLQNPASRLKPGMFAVATFLDRPFQALVVPTAALLTDEGSFVWVEMSPWTFVRRPVTLTSQDEKTAVVAKGLAPGERIVVKNASLLQ